MSVEHVCIYAVQALSKLLFVIDVCRHSLAARFRTIGIYKRPEEGDERRGRRGREGSVVIGTITGKVLQLTLASSG